MTGEASFHPDAQAFQLRSTRALHHAENGVVSVALVAMVLIPLAEIVLRRFAGRGITGATSIVQHLTLVVSFVGAAIAAREGRLLSLATALFFKGRLRAIARVGSAGVAAAITAFLAAGSARFVMLERDAGGDLAYGIPLWVIQAALPVGFAAIAVRLVLHAGETRRDRLIALAIAVALALAALFLPVDPWSLRWPAVAALTAAAFFGAPIFVILGGLALILFWSAGEPISALAVSHYSLVVNPSIPAIPLFTLAGYFLAEGGASKRLVAVFDHVLGGLRGGAAIVTVLACAFFTSFTGGSGVTILALGGLLMPVLIGERYGEKTSLGLITGAGSLGILFPPCLPLILYAIVAQVSLDRIFLGGILPGFLLLILSGCWGVAKAPRVEEKRKFDGRAALRAIWVAKWELLLPVVVVGALFSGLATPVESAALTALYAMVVETFIYRDFKTAGELSRVIAECGLLVGGVLLILGVALGFTNYLIDAEVPARAVDWVTGSIESPLLFLLLLNVFLLIVGCLMDIYSAIVVVVPLIVPIGVAFGIDPIHLGIVFLANLELGYLTPPVGLNLFLASYRFDKPITTVYRAAFPMLIVLLIGVLLITYVPAITTWLPSLLGPE